MTITVSAKFEFCSSRIHVCTCVNVMVIVKHVNLFKLMCTNSITCNENEINMWNGLCKYEVDWIHVHVCVAPPIVVGA